MGRERVICCWEIDGVLVDPGPESSVQALFDGLGGTVPRAILLTHIHLDHAGATGAVLDRWPDLPIYVHAHGAPHLIDPSRLAASASRLYPDMDERWGGVQPVPEANVHVIADGDRVLDTFRTVYTPGHASHHAAFLHEPSGVALVGDVLGVRVAPEPYTLMPTPPPDIDIELWASSIDRVEALRPSAVALTHFGLHEDVPTLVADARTELHRWAAEARDAAGDDDFLATFEADLDAGIGDDDLRAVYRQASPPPLQYLGLDRYWTKLGAERHAA